MKSAVAVLALLSSAEGVVDANDTDPFTECWKAEPIHLVKSQQHWYDACLGLTYNANASNNTAACKEQCYADVKCSVWQMVHDAPSPAKCWSGSVVHGCLSRGVGQGSTTLDKFEGDLVDGERIKHGDTKVVKDNHHMETLGLKNYKEIAGTDAERMQRCQLFCETDITCTVWEYAPTDTSIGGCWMEHIPGAEAGEEKNNSEYSKLMMGGQLIEHFCPPKPTPEPEEGFPWLWVILGILLTLCCLGAIGYFLAKPDDKSSSSASSESDDDDDGGQTRGITIPDAPKPASKPAPSIMMVSAPQPTVVIPQTSVVTVPTYEVARPVMTEMARPVMTEMARPVQTVPVQTAQPIQTTGSMIQAAPMSPRTLMR
jgi:hypothetical protein